MGSPFQLPQIQFPQPTIEENTTQPSGFGGKGLGLAVLADKFLAGVSRGRALAFQRSQQQEERSLFGLRSAMQDIQQANIPDELKQQQLAPLQDMFARLVAGAGDDQGKQKGKKGGGQSDDAHAHPLQGFTQAIKGFAARMVGPGAEKQPVSTEDIHAAVGQAYAALKNTPTISTVNQKLDTTYSTVLNAQEQAAGRKFTASEQLKIPALASIASQSSQLNKGKPSPVIGGFLSAGEQREKEQSPEAQAKAAADTALAKERDAQAESEKALAQQRAREKGTPYQGKDGGIYLERGGKLYPLGSDQALSEQQSKEIAPKPVAKPTADKFITSKPDKQGNVHVYNATTKQDTIIPGKYDTPGQLQAAREFQTNSREKAKRDAGNARAVAVTRGMFEARRKAIAAMNPDTASKELKDHLAGEVDRDEAEYDRLLKEEQDSAAPPTGGGKSGSRPPLSSFQR